MNASRAGYTIHLLKKLTKEADEEDVLQFFRSSTSPVDPPGDLERPALHLDTTTKLVYEWNIKNQMWRVETAHRHYTKTEVISPELPYSLLAPVRLVIEVIFTLNPTATKPAVLTVSRSGGISDVSISAMGTLNDPTRHASFRVSPGDMITFTDASEAPAVATIDLLIIFEEE